MQWWVQNFEMKGGRVWLGSGAVPSPKSANKHMISNCWESKCNVAHLLKS